MTTVYAHDSADAYIERETTRSVREGRRVFAATNDNGVQLAAGLHGATCVSANWLVRELKSSRAGSDAVVAPSSLRRLRGLDQRGEPFRTAHVLGVIDLRRRHAELERPPPERGWLEPPRLGPRESTTCCCCGRGAPEGGRRGGGGCPDRQADANSHGRGGRGAHR